MNAGTQIGAERSCSVIEIETHERPKRTLYIKYKVACMCFSATNGSGPAYPSELLHVYTPSRTLRSSSGTRMLKI